MCWLNGASAASLLPPAGGPLDVLRLDLRGFGLGRALLREAVRRRLADPAVRFAILAVNARNARMLRLPPGPLRPFLPRRSELRVSRKELRV